MLRKYLLLIIFLMASLNAQATTHYLSKQARQFAGYWYTYDGESPTVKGIAHFYVSKNHVVGKGYVTFYTDKIPEKHCSKCKGRYRNKPIHSVPFFHGIIKSNGKKQPCKIMNTATGNNYSCFFHLTHSGKTLVIRVYLGTTMFGRTLYWRRAPKRVVKKYQGKRHIKIRR